MKTCNCTKCNREYQMPDGFMGAILCENCDGFMNPPSSWIKVKDQFPKLDEEVLTFRSSSDGKFQWRETGRLIALTERSNGKTGEWSIGDDYSIYDVTHWQPLPEPPKD